MSIYNRAKVKMLFRMLLGQVRASFRGIAILGVISGLSSAAMLAILNNAAGKVNSGEMNVQGFLLFVLALLISSYTKKVSTDRTQSIVQNILRAMRVRIADKIRKSSLVSFEARGKESYYVALTQQTALVSNASMSLINAAQSVVIIIACIAYVGWISPISLIVILLFVGLGVLIYQFKDNELQPELVLAAQKEGLFFSLLNHILDGFKELVLSRKKSNHIFRDFNAVADEAAQLKMGTSTKLTDTVMFSQAAMYLLIALLVIVFPLLKLTSYDVVPKLIVAILFFWTSLEGVVAAIPDYFKVTSALAHIRHLENELEEIEDTPASISGSASVVLPFKTELALENVQYRHCDKNDIPLFAIGPMDMTLKKGEIVFICGGNGSGKTTLMKVIASLYPLGHGVLRLDNRLVNVDNQTAYRQNYAAIFADYHLFDRFYGLRDVKAKKVEDLLDKLGLKGKTAFANNGFTNKNLSFGQRKRLAIIAALLEERTIYLLDEPAAGFDPEFRQYFYEDFLVQLKEQGKTIVVVTHDDRYFTCCDRLVKVDQGLIVEVQEK